MKRNRCSKLRPVGLNKLDSSFCTEEKVFDPTDVPVEVHEEPTTHVLMIEKLKRWLKSHGRGEEATPQTPQRCSRTIGVPADPEEFKMSEEILAPVEFCKDAYGRSDGRPCNEGRLFIAFGARNQTRSLRDCGEG